jgi:2-isopropylmalate synthase
VLIDSRDQDHIWSTIGVSEDIIEASWQALADSFQYKLTREKELRGVRQEPLPLKIT